MNAHLRELAERAMRFDQDKADAAFRAAASPARILALLDALEPFAGVSGEGDDDFGNATKVIITFGRSIVYDLTLGDFRRAQEALADPRQ